MHARRMMHVAGCALAIFVSGCAKPTDLRPALDASRKELAASQAEVASLKAEVLRTTVQLHDAQAKITQSEARVADALKGQKEAEDRVLDALKENQKLAQAEADRVREREEITRAHYGTLSESERATMHELTQKVKDHTLTLDEFQVLQRLCGGDLAYLGFPKLRKIHIEIIQRMVKADPSREPDLRRLEPEAFTSDGKR